jgi:putative transposase
MTRLVLEAGLEAEMAAHLGYEARAAEGRNGDSSRDGKRTKTVITEVGPVEIEVPRDRASSFAPVTDPGGQFATCRMACVVVGGLV